MRIQNFFLLVLTLYSLLLWGCVATPVVMTPEAQSIRTGKADLPANAQELGPVAGRHGSGCGAYGARGTYEGAYAALKNQAATLGATYVQIITAVPPHQEGYCFNNVYEITGTAYRIP